MFLRLISLCVFLTISGLAQANGFEGLQVDRMMGVRLVTQCEVPGGFISFNQQASLQGEGTVDYLPHNKSGEQLTLMKNSRGYRLYLGENLVTGEKNLKSSGDNDLSIHLLMDRGKGPEHLVFMIDLEGKGDLVWSNDTNTNFSSCSI